MQKFFYIRLVLTSLFLIALILLVACQPTATNSNIATVKSNVNSSANSNANSSANINTSNTNSVSTTVETKEPDQYQANITLKFEAIGNQKQTALPVLTAKVARSGADRRMEFSLPNGEKAIYLDKPDTNYLILPNRKQYAVLDRESLGFDIRQMMMPTDIINRVKSAPGVERVGEENYNAKTVIRYRYGAVTNTQTQAGQLNTDSFFLIDKETGLPLRSETVSTAPTGNVQGYNNLRIITDMTDISLNIAPELFAAPTDFQKIESEQIRAQVNLIFNAAVVLLNQALKSAQSNSNTNSAVPSPSVTK